MNARNRHIVEENVVFRGAANGHVALFQHIDVVDLLAANHQEARLLDGLFFFSIDWLADADPVEFDGGSAQFKTACMAKPSIWLNLRIAYRTMLIHSASPYDQGKRRIRDIVISKKLIRRFIVEYFRFVEEYVFRYFLIAIETGN